jgi:2-methylisocitrate lyase-like PEP mutase family enzyme
MSDVDDRSATAFRALHAPGRLLLLPNAWDAGSARLIAEAGAPAIATTSAGVAWAHGYADGDRLPTAKLLATVTEIARVVRVPLSVDIEGGYSDEPAKVGELVRALADAGAAGLNIEDGADAPDQLVAKIEAAKSAAARAGVDVFVNARTDVVLRALVPAAGARTETLARIERYRAAGCDGIFVPGLAAPADIAAVVAAAAPLPLNLLVVSGLAPAAELRALGVRRLSAGSRIAAAALGVTARLAGELLADGRTDSLFDSGIDYATINRMLARA